MFHFPHSIVTCDLYNNRVPLLRPSSLLCVIALFCAIFPQALAPIGAIFGAPVSGTIADKWGRKTALIFSGLPYIIGYLILSYAHYLPTALSFKALALTGRFITGVGMGWAGSVGPVSQSTH